MAPEGGRAQRASRRGYVPALASRRAQDASDAHPRRDIPQVLVARHLPARPGSGAVPRGPRGPWVVRPSHLGLSADSLRVRRHEPVRLGRDHWVRCSAHPPHPRTAPPPMLLPLTWRTRHTQAGVRARSRRPQVWERRVSVRPSIVVTLPCTLRARSLGFVVITRGL